MEQYYEVIERTLELLETIEEGLEYIKIQAEQLEYEEAIAVSKDTRMAIESVESAISPLLEAEGENNLDKLTSDTMDALGKTIRNAEDGMEIEMADQIENEVLPKFFIWKDEIEKVLKPYILS